MLHHADFEQTVDRAVVDANDMLRRMLRAQGDDGTSPRRVDFGFRRKRLFSVKPHLFEARMAELGLTPLPTSETTGAEGDLIFWIEACPHATDFDLLDTMATHIAAQCGWRSEGWSSFVR
ncbi:MAG: hypothetical protein AAGF30_09560, partial [Pseudomonadota bacterium]